jgi:rod shape-determining protein MreB
VVLTPADIAQALDETIENIAEFASRTLEDLPPEIAADIGERGICLTGGGSLLDGLDGELHRRVGVGFTSSETPMECVVKGTALVLEDIERWGHLLLEISR